MNEWKNKRKIWSSSTHQTIDKIWLFITDSIYKHTHTYTSTFMMKMKWDEMSWMSETETKKNIWKSNFFLLILASKKRSIFQVEIIWFVFTNENYKHQQRQQYMNPDNLIPNVIFIIIIWDWQIIEN